MKKVFAILTLIVFTGISFLSVAKDSPKNDNKTESQTTQVLMKQMDYPTFAKEKKIEGDVYVSFTLNKDGRIENICANSSSELLKNYVVEKLQASNIPGTIADATQVFYIKFSFRLY